MTVVKETGAMKTVIAIGEMLGRDHGITDAKIICKPLFDQLEVDSAVLRRYDNDAYEMDPDTGELKLKPYERPTGIKIYTHGADIEVFER